MDRRLTTTYVNSDLVSVIASEMASGVEIAVERWMAQIEASLEDTRLTTLGRLNAVRDIVDKYKQTTGKAQLGRRTELRAS